MIAHAGYWLLVDGPLLLLTALCTHWVVSGSQTILHRWLGHRRLGGVLFRNHINFHHAIYAKGHLATVVAPGQEGNNTPFFLLPMIVVGSAMYFVLPHAVFVVVVLASAASFYAHVQLDKAYHVQGSRLARFAWFRRKQQMHFVHHLHANANFAVIDFFWDRLLGTYRKPDRQAH
jgi:sterol desaturase/sphingolipid hydroxylase (fatty acid hydroxylase superfamily)